MIRCRAIMKALKHQPDWRPALVCSLCMFISVGEASAALGQAPSALTAAVKPVAVTAARKSAALNGERSSFYSVHELQLENGTLVREYATPSGLVFAVTWVGPVLPDLSVLLGEFFSTFKLETGQTRMTRSRGAPVSFERDGVIVSSRGRMRNFEGYAYAPAFVPSGVNINDVLP